MAWFTHIPPVESPDAMVACGALAGGEPGNAQAHHWDTLCTEFTNAFSLASMP